MLIWIMCCIRILVRILPIRIMLLIRIAFSQLDCYTDMGNALDCPSDSDHPFVSDYISGSDSDSGSVFRARILPHALSLLRGQVMYVGWGLGDDC